jgi:hypothetical protein
MISTTVSPMLTINLTNTNVFYRGVCELLLDQLQMVGLHAGY